MNVHEIVEDIKKEGDRISRFMLCVNTFMRNPDIIRQMYEDGEFKDKDVLYCYSIYLAMLQIVTILRFE